MQEYKLRGKGLGIRNWIKSRTAKTSEGQLFARLFFRAIIIAAPFTKVPVLSGLIRKLALMSDRHHTAGYTVPIAVDLSDHLDQVDLPVELLKKAVREASYRAIVNECLCRDLYSCQDYPRDLGCLFIGHGSEVCVTNGIAREATLEESLSHIDRAARLGLVGKAFWVEIEEFVWGFKDENMNRFLEICFCCSCCCSAFKFDKKAGRGAETLLNRSIGWKTEVLDSCTDCGSCLDSCPRNLISQGVDKVKIDDRLCSGCGVCVTVCPNDALKLDKKEATKKDITDYFEGLDLDL